MEPEPSEVYLFVCSNLRMSIVFVFGVQLCFSYEFSHYNRRIVLIPEVLICSGLSIRFCGVITFFLL